MRNKSTRYNHLIGTRQGQLEVLDIVYGQMKNRHAAVKVLCYACNQEKYISAQTFEKGRSKSCGCQRYKNRPTGMRCKKTKNLVGQRFGKLTVLSCDGLIKKRVRWLCRCDCGNEKSVAGLYLNHNETTSCGCNKYRLGDENPLWTGHGEITGTIWGNVKTAAKKRNLPVEVSIQDAWDKFLAQDRKCVLTQLELTIGEDASLDRIDSSKGYTKENIQWVHKDVNIMKWDFGQDYFIKVCHMIAKNNENIPEAIRSRH